MAPKSHCKKETTKQIPTHQQIPQKIITVPRGYTCIHNYHQSPKPVTPYRVTGFLYSDGTSQQPKDSCYGSRSETSHTPEKATCFCRPLFIASFPATVTAKDLFQKSHHLMNRHSRIPKHLPRPGKPLAHANLILMKPNPLPCQQPLPAQLHQDLGNQLHALLQLCIR